MAPQRYVMDDALALMKPLAGKHYDARVVVALEQVVRELEPPPVSEYLVLPHELKAGMKLARDLLSPKGTLLLPKGLVFNPKVLAQVQKFASAASVELAVYVVKDRLAPPKTPAAADPSAAAAAIPASARG